MQKSELNIQDLNDWMRDHWILYSSQVYNGKLLRLWVNGNGRFRVVYGKDLLRDILYEGSQMTHAIAAWNAV